MGSEMKYKSIAVWPEEVKTGKIPNESDDTHRSREAAECVCRGLREHGLGGEGKIFPLSTRVEPFPHFGAWFRYRRRLAKKSLVEVSDATGGIVSVSQISRMEHNLEHVRGINEIRAMLSCVGAGFNDVVAAPIEEPHHE